MKIIALILLIIILILFFVHKPWKQRTEEEKWSNLPDEDSSRKLSQIKQNAEDVRNNEHKFYH